MKANSLFWQYEFHVNPGIPKSRKSSRIPEFRIFSFNFVFSHYGLSLPPKTVI
jgi:hypothetical protein